MNTLSSPPLPAPNLSISDRLDELARQKHRLDFIPEESLKKLFPKPNLIAARGNLYQRPVELFTDSRQVIPGSVFFALDGLRTDGHRFIQEALSRRALAIVSERPLPADLPITAIQVRDIRQAIATAARKFYGTPDKKLTMVGVTGTKGKTTLTYLMRHILKSANVHCGMLSTIENDLGRQTMPASRTTAEAIDLSRHLSKIVENGCRHAVMEVSSHGLEQGRVLGMGFEVAVFTNLTPEHQDYHGSMENYFNAKKKLFTGEVGPKPKRIVINLDDPYGKRLFEELSEAQKNADNLLTYGHSAACDIQIESEMGNNLGSEFIIKIGSGDRYKYKGTLPMIGPHNLMNAAGAVTAAYGLGLSVKDAVASLAEFEGVPGRLEKINCGQSFDVIVDYAHTDEALRCTLESLRAIYPEPKRIITVFGCGGNRDQFKRPRMTEAAMRLSDFAIATADNPRREKLEDIFEMMKKGVVEGRAIEFITERRGAIDRAFSLAQPGDCVMIAGKGHETYQEFDDIIVPFDDRAVARELLRSASQDSKQILWNCDEMMSI